MSVHAWRAAARCAEIGDLGLFFPEKRGNSSDALEAKKICGGCEVRRECLDWALRNLEVGIWGGTSDSQRQEMRRWRKIPARRTDRSVDVEILRSRWRA